MNKKLIFVYEPNGLGNARTKISRKQTDEIKTDSFEYLSLTSFFESDFLTPDFLILEDEAQYQIELIEASLEIDEISSILICDSLSTIQGVIEKLKAAPKIITLDYKIGANNSPENLPTIYKKIRDRFKTSAIVGYTNFGRKKADKEFSAKSADELTHLLRSNGESVIEKSGMTKTALSSILFDRIQVQTLRKKLAIVSSENTLLKKAVEAQEDIFAEKINAYVESVTMRNLERPIVGVSSQVKKIKFFAEKYAKSDIAVLINGEQGTGKELVARAIHRLSKRCTANFVAVDCGAINPNLFESELFGHEEGAFTGAMKRHIGKIEQANKGTLFLDEIGNLDITSQSKLLRALQEKVIVRMGSTKEIPVDFRLISATNKNLPQLISEGKFHTDLYQRILSYFPLMPALRERTEDIPNLIEYYIKKDNAHFNLTKDAISYLSHYHWEGNVRQLQKFIENLNVLFDSDSVSEKDVKALLQSTQLSRNSSGNMELYQDCSEAESFLDEINSLLETNEQFAKSGRVNLKELAASYGEGLSRNSFYEKRVKFTPCIQRLLIDFPENWPTIRSKKLKLTSKPMLKR